MANGDGCNLLQTGFDPAKNISKHYTYIEQTCVYIYNYIYIHRLVVPPPEKYGIPPVCEHQHAAPPRKKNSCRATQDAQGRRTPNLPGVGEKCCGRSSWVYSMVGTRIIICFSTQVIRRSTHFTRVSTTFIGFSM